MTPLSCPRCGHQANPNAAICPSCGHALNNGAAPLPATSPPPPEVSTWSIEKTPPDLLAWARQTFDVEEHRAAMREIEETGGFSLDDFIDEIEGRSRCDD